MSKKLLEQLFGLNAFLGPFFLVLWLQKKFLGHIFCWDPNIHGSNNIFWVKYFLVLINFGVNYEGGVKGKRITYVLNSRALGRFLYVDLGGGWCSSCDRGKTKSTLSL